MALWRGPPFRHGRGIGGDRRIGVGLGIILSGQVDVYRYDAHGERQHFYTFGPGSFLGELAQLAGRPSLVDAVASEPVEALIFPPDAAGSADRRSGAGRTASCAR